MYKEVFHFAQLQLNALQHFHSDASWEIMNRQISNNLKNGQRATEGDVSVWRSTPARMTVNDLSACSRQLAARRSTATGRLCRLHQFVAVYCTVDSAQGTLYSEYPSRQNIDVDAMAPS